MQYVKVEAAHSSILANTPATATIHSKIAIPCFTPASYRQQHDEARCSTTYWLPLPAPLLHSGSHKSQALAANRHACRTANAIPLAISSPPAASQPSYPNQIAQSY